MPRRKKASNQHFPVGLTVIKVRGKRRFRYRNSSQKDFYFPLGTLELDAIETATAINRKNRNSSLDLLLDRASNKQRLIDWIPKITKLVREEELNVEKISEDVYKTFLLDLERLEKSHGKIYLKDLSLKTVNEFLDLHHSTASYNVYNAKLSFLKKVFSYLMDEGAITCNFAKRKKIKPKPKKIRGRLNVEAFQILCEKAEPFLNIAIRLAYQTTHAVNEISNAKYSDCIWLDTPEVDQETRLLIYGHLYIHRQKTRKQEASRVSIPITEKIKVIIDDSTADGIKSPYIVHRIKSRKSRKLAKGITHHTQVRNADISEGFTKLRDQLGLYKELNKEQRPTFHELRSLSIFLYSENDLDPQERAAHSDAKTTEKYKRGHKKWVEVEPAQLNE
jgi:hypothetical protein